MGCSIWRRCCKCSTSGRTSAAAPPVPPAPIIVPPADHDGVTPFNVDINWDQPVTGFAVGDIVTTGPVTLSAFSGSGDAYSVLATPTGNLQITFDVPAGVAQNGAAQPNTAATQVVVAFVADVIQPTAIITAPAIHGGPTLPFPITITWSEPVVGFIDTDVTVILGNISNFAGGPTVWTADITANGTPDVTLRIVAGRADDLSGNPNLATPDTIVTFADLIGPDVSINVPATHDGATIFFAQFVFTENVTGFTVGDIVVTNGTLSSFGGSGSTYTVTVTPTGGSDITIEVPAGVAIDGASNPNNASPVETITFVP